MKGFTLKLSFSSLGTPAAQVSLSQLVLSHATVLGTTLRLGLQ